MTDTTVITGEHEAQFGDYFALLKPRVMSLVVFTAFVGLLVAPVGVHPMVGFAAILFIAVGAGASGALNMWWDADIDAVMRRTKKRPLPSGRVTPGEALGLGLALSGLSVVMLALATNWVAAGLLAFTIFFYVVVYTMWLKRWTPQNIVIGGAAGRLPAGDRLGRGDGQRFGRGLADVRADLHVDAAAFLGARALHEVGLRRCGRADADSDAWSSRNAAAHPGLHRPCWPRRPLALAFTPVGGPRLPSGRGCPECLSSCGAPGRIWRRDEAMAEARRLRGGETVLPVVAPLPVRCISARFWWMRSVRLGGLI